MRNLHIANSVGLVVDDNPRIRHVLSEALRRRGISVREAGSGREALTLAQASVPDFVITDIEMPDVDGLELCRRLRESPATSKVPIIIVSAATTTQGDDATAAGCDVVLPKPCSPAVLVETIQRLLLKPVGGPPKV